MGNGVKNDTTCHLLGHAVYLGRRVIQRCLICGYKLADGPADQVLVERAGSLVRTTRDSRVVVDVTQSPSFDSVKNLPTDICVDLVEY